jgi:parallel beta-helix repeat protein
MATTAFVAGSIAFTAAPAQAATLQVGPGQPYTTIQSAVNAAHTDDTINVAAGTYAEHVSINAKYISLVGSPGAIIDGGRPGTPGNATLVITNVPYAASRVKVSGFTIKGGYGQSGQGGGITIALNSSPEIFNNVIEANRASAYGGGISVHTNSNPIIRGNTIDGNTAATGGAGIFVVGNSSPIIFGNTITDNHTSGASIPNGGSSGGGIYLENSGDANARSYPVVMKNTISGNTAEFAGGGIMMRTGVNAIVEGNTIESNSASYGGGVHVETTGSTVVIASNTIRSNTALFNGLFSGSGFGGGIALFDRSNTTIESNIIDHNTASSGGGGISAAEGTVSQLLSNLISGNGTSVASGGNQDGGGLYVANAQVTATNNQFVDNTADLGGAIALLDNAKGMIVNNTIVRNQQSVLAGGAVFIQQTTTSATLANNIFTQNQGYQIFEEQPRPGRLDNNLLTTPGPTPAASGSGLYFSYTGNGRMDAASINSTVAEAAGNIDTDPGFTNLTGNDFSLTPASTAIGAATTSGVPAVTDDYRNVIRATAPLDIGAFEYETAPVTKSPVYRFWSESKRGHFYTIAQGERDLVASTYSPSEWRYEYIAYDAFATQVLDTIPLYRFYSSDYQGHFFTADAGERDFVDRQYEDHEWVYEGIAYYVFPLSTTNTSRSVFRFWSPDNKHHFYTASQAESDFVRNNYPANVWTYEGPNFRVPQ